MQHEHYTHTAPDIPPSTALSIFFFLLHFLLMQLLFFLLVPFQDFLHSLLCSRPILHTEQFDQQITHDHSIMGTANDKSYDTTHDNLEDDTHQYIHQVSHQDSTPSAVILHLIPPFPTRSKANPAEASQTHHSRPHSVKSLYFVSVHLMQKQQKPDIRFPQDAYAKTHNYVSAGSIEPFI